MEGRFPSSRPTALKCAADRQLHGGGIRRAHCLACAQQLYRAYGDEQPFLEKFESYIKKGGVLIADSSLVQQKPTRDDIKHFELPATLMASEAGNKAFSNIYLIGKLIKETGIITPESFEKALYGVLSKSKHHLIPQEMEALKAGMEY